jgi:hypothetical protein
MRIQSLLYAALNPAIRALLRSPAHGVVSRNPAVLRNRGRRSGRAFETPLSYVRDGNRVRFMSSHATRWWTNFGGIPTPVEVEIAREVLPGMARLLKEDSAALRDGVRQFLTALPRDAMIYGIGLDAERRPREADIGMASTHVVLVEVDLTEGSP